MAKIYKFTKNSNSEHRFNGHCLKVINETRPFENLRVCTKVKSKDKGDQASTNDCLREGLLQLMVTFSDPRFLRIFFFFLPER